MDIDTTVLDHVKGIKSGAQFVWKYGKVLCSIFAHKSVSYLYEKHEKFKVDFWAN